MGNHTKTPWELEPADRGFVISALNGQYDVCVVRNIGNQDNEANAELIVRAVNNHEKLVEALWHAMQCWEYDGVSDEHGAVAMYCSELLAALEVEKGGEL